MIHSLQFLRFIAALMVVFVHTRSKLKFLDGPELLWPNLLGRAGVDIFFVISGFIMLYTYNARPISPIHFFGKRFFRLWPLYALATLFAGFMAYKFPIYYSGWAHIPHILKSMFFIPDLRPKGGGIAPIIAPGWTLNLEMAFYFLFAIGLFFKRHALVSGGLLVGFFGLNYLLKEQGVVFAAYATDGGVILEFLLGYLLYQSYIRKWRIPTWLAFIFIIGGFAAMPSVYSLGPQSRLLTLGIPAFFICLGFLQLDPWFARLKPLTLKAIDFMGRITFALYILHNFVVQSLFRYFQHLDRTYDAWFDHAYVYMAVVFVLAIAL
ncbi:MAG TPA: acyltransferase, partial [Hellea balneolensis]|nr:acyltransferase [Hellea balneolensis]